LTCIGSITQLSWTKIPASEHVSNCCDPVAVNNTKNDVMDLLGADWLEFMQLGHITVAEPSMVIEGSVPLYSFRQIHV
jgi:hypothetical protein